MHVLSSTKEDPMALSNYELLTTSLHITVSEKANYNQALSPISYTYSLIQAISKALLQVHYYSEALPTQHGHCAGISR